MDKYYALSYVESGNADYWIVDSKYSKSNGTPGKSEWQRKLDKKGNAPQLVKIMRSDLLDVKYRIEGNLVYRK